MKENKAKSNADIIKESARETARKQLNDFFISTMPAGHYTTSAAPQELYEYQTHAMGNWTIDVSNVDGISYTTSTDADFRINEAFSQATLSNLIDRLNNSHVEVRLANE